PPHFSAVGDLQAREIAVLGEHVGAIAVDGRRAARARSAIVGAGRSERLRPQPSSVGAAQRVDDALTAFRALDENAIALDGDGTIAAADRRNRPGHWRPGCGPLLQQADLF